METPHNAGAPGLPGTATHPTDDGPSPLVTAGRVINKAVYNPCGDQIGRIEDIAIDKQSGEVAYAILTFGGFLGIGERFFPVPWRLLDYQPEKAGFRIPCTT